MCLYERTLQHILKSLIFGPFWVVHKGDCVHLFPAPPEGHVTGGEADTVDSFKMYIVFNNLLLYFTV